MHKKQLSLVRKFLIFGSAFASLLLWFQNCSGFGGRSGLLSKQQNVWNQPLQAQDSTKGKLSLSASASVNAGALKTAFVKVIYSFPIPVEAVSYRGLSGKVSIDSSGSGFNEALFTIGYSPSGACPASGTQAIDYDTIFNAMPDNSILNQFILKSSPGNPHSEITTNVNLPTSLPIQGCAFVILDGGNVLTMTSNVNLLFSTDPATANASHFGTGGEFCYGATFGCEKHTSQQGVTFASVTRVPGAGSIVGLYGNVSDADYYSPSGTRWGVHHAWYVDQGCQQFGGPGEYGPGDYVSQVPANSTSLYSFDLEGTQGELQQAIDKSMQVAVNDGDCIVHLGKVDGNVMVDSEIQVQAFYVPSAPIDGVIDAVSDNGDGTYSVTGWACLQGTDAAIQVDLFFGAAAGIPGGRFNSGLPSEPAVASACQAAGSSYRFSVLIPKDVVQANAGKPITVKGVSPDGSYERAIYKSGKFTVPSGAAAPRGGSGATPGGSGSSAPTPTPAANPVGQIVVQSSNKCVDVIGASGNNGVELQQYDCGGQANQQWKFVPVGGGFYKIVSSSSGKCIDVVGASSVNGARVQQWDCSQAPNQLFQPIASNGQFKLVAQHSGKCLDFIDGKAGNGLRLQQWDCNASAQQTFQLPSGF